MRVVPLVIVMAMTSIAVLPAMPVAAEPTAASAVAVAAVEAVPTKADAATPPKASEPEGAPKPAAAVVPPRPTRPAAQPSTLLVRIDLSSQRLSVQYDGRVQHSWPISSGRSGFTTPRGTFRPQWTAKMWYSRKYDNAPMPHSVFFNGGIAVHATNSTHLLGQPASHGCIRLAPGNAARFYSLVHRHGLKQTRIVVHGTSPAPRIAQTRSRDVARERARLVATTRGASTARPAPRQVQRVSPPAVPSQLLSWGTATPPRAPAGHAVRRSAGGVIHLPPGSPYRGRDSFVLNGVRYVRVR